MNRRQKEIQQLFLDNEKAVLKKLEENYQDALFEINDRLAVLLGRDDAYMQHVIYQVEYQKALKKQVEAIIETLHSNEFETVSEYLAKSYEDGFLGTMYDMQGQGIPLVIPIDQEQVVAAIQHETKLSEGLYAALGKDTKRLSKQIAGEISRGISNNATYNEMARNIASFSNIPRNNAARIARTEAHRIQCKATADAQWKAKEKGADVVKQWDASLDGKTRPHHRKLDGQIRELDEPFEVDGKSAMQPGDFGDPAEDCNCRCALLQRARWALGNDFTKWDQDTGGLVEIKAKDYDSFKSKYAKEAERVRDSVQKMNDEDTSKELKKQLDEFKKMTEGYSYDEFIKDFGSIDDGFEGASEDEIRKAKEIAEKIEYFRNKLKEGHTEHYNKIMEFIDANGVEYLEVKKLQKKRSTDEIIAVLGGGDMTGGSCSSLGFAYAGQRNGFDVLDFRGGKSREAFANHERIRHIASLEGVVSTINKSNTPMKDSINILNSMENGKEYYFTTCRHSAIVRKTNDGILQYLELQSGNSDGYTNGWHDFNAPKGREIGIKETLNWRFSVPKNKSKYNRSITMIDIDSFKDNDEFKKILGYINTSSDKQKKGIQGSVK